MMLARHCRCVCTTNRYACAPTNAILDRNQHSQYPCRNSNCSPGSPRQRLVMRGLVPQQTRTERRHGSKLEPGLSSCKLAFLQAHSCKNDAVKSHGCRAQGADAAALCELGQFAQDDALRTHNSVRQRIHTRSDRRRDPRASSHDAQTHRGRCANRCRLHLHATHANSTAALPSASAKRPNTRRTTHDRSPAPRATRP